MTLAHMDGDDYTCHVTANGNVHSGLPRDCLTCRPWSVVVVGDSALERCGTDEPGTTGGIRPSVKTSLTTAPNWSESILIVALAAVCTLSIGGLLVVVIAQCIRWAG